MRIFTSRTLTVLLILTLLSSRIPCTTLNQTPTLDTIEIYMPVNSVYSRYVNELFPQTSINDSTTYSSDDSRVQITSVSTTSEVLPISVDEGTGSNFKVKGTWDRWSVYMFSDNSFGTWKVDRNTCQLSDQNIQISTDMVKIQDARYDGHRWITTQFQDNTTNIMVSFDNKQSYILSQDGILNKLNTRLNISFASYNGKNTAIIYQRYYENGNNSNAFLYVSDDNQNSGSVILDQTFQPNFPKKSAIGIYSINKVGSQMEIGYYAVNEGNLPYIALCDFNPKVSTNQLSNCTNIYPSWRHGIAKLDSNAEKGYIYHEDHKQVYICDYQAPSPSPSVEEGEPNRDDQFVNCKYKNLNISPNLRGDYINLGYNGAIDIEFIDPSGLTKDIVDIFRRAYSYNINVNDDDKITYTSIDDFASNGLVYLLQDSRCVVATRADNTYQVYGYNKDNQYIRIDGTKYSSTANKQQYDIKIIQTTGDVVTTRPISLFISEDMSAYTELKPLSDSQQYKNVEWRKLPLDSSYTVGNNVQYSINPNPDNFFSIKLLDETELSMIFPKRFSSIGKHGMYEVRFLGSNFGVVYDESSRWVIYFYCDLSLENGYICDVSANYAYQLDKNHELRYITMNDLEMENGIILASTLPGTGTKLVYFSVQDKSEVWIYQMKEDIPIGRIFFKISEKLYTFFQSVPEQNVVNVWQAWNKNISAMQDNKRQTIAPDGNLLPIGTPFCPETIVQCPLNPSIIHINSRCNGYNERFTFSTYWADRALNMQFVSRSTFNFNFIGPDNDKETKLDICHMGDETIIANTRTNQVSAVLPQYAISYTDLSAKQFGFVDVSGLYCVRGSQSVVVSGHDSEGNLIAGVIRGNSFEDIRSRWVSVINIKGKINHVAGDGDHVTISSHETDGINHVYLAYLNGPYLMYKNADLQENEFSIIATSGAQTSKQSFTFNYSDPEDNLTLDKPSTLSPIQGLYSLRDIATFHGPIFTINTENDQVQSNNINMVRNRMLTQIYNEKINESPHYLTTSAPVSRLFGYDKPGTFINYREPQTVYSASNTIGQDLQVGVRVNEMSTLLYYFKDIDNFDFADDVGYRCSSYDIDFGIGPIKNGRMDTAIFFAGICDEGGEVWFRYFVKGAESWSSKGGIRGLNKGNWEVSTSLMGYKVQETVNMPVFLATALNKDVNEVRIWTFQLDKDENGNYYFTMINESQKLTNINSISSFGITNSADHPEPLGFLIYTEGATNKVNFRSLGVDAEQDFLNSIKLPIDRKSDFIDCNSFPGADINIVCLFWGTGSNLIQDLRIGIDFSQPKNLKTYIKSSQQFKYFSGYLPTKISFNDQLIVVKGLSQNQDSHKEALLLFDRIDTKNQFVSWGMLPEEYYNNIPKQPPIYTESVPLVTKINTITHIFTTQFVMTNDPNTTLSPFRVFKYSKNIQLSLNANLDSDQVQQMKLIFNQISNTSSIEKNEMTSLSIGEIFTGQAPAPSSGSSGSQSSSESSGGGKSDITSSNLWMWIIIGFLIVVIIALVFRIQQIKGDLSTDEGYNKEVSSTQDEFLTINNETDRASHKDSAM